jgi:hypothetical protein
MISCGKIGKIGVRGASEHSAKIGLVFSRHLCGTADTVGVAGYKHVVAGGKNPTNTSVPQHCLSSRG